MGPMAVLVALAGAAGCGGADDAPTTAAPSPTASASSTTSSVTTAAPTATAPTTTAPIDDTGCAERDRTTATFDQTVYATFSPLGTEPSLAVSIPSWTDDLGQFVERRFAALQQVPGGVLIAVASTDLSLLAVVNFDGSLRWRRCVDSSLSVFSPSDPSGVERVLVFRYLRSNEVEISVLDMSDGTFSEPDSLAPISRGSEVSYTQVGTIGDVLVLEPWAPDLSGPLDAPLTTVDLRTFELGELPAPPPGSGGVTVLSDGRVAWSVAGPAGFPTALALLDGGRWVAPTDLSDVWDPQVYRWQVDGAQTTMPAAYGADGTQWWVRAELNLPRGELIAARDFGDVLVVSVCSDALCAASTLVGLDIRTGESRWEQPDYSYSVAAGAEGVALVNGPDGGAIISTDTGKVLPGQEFGDGWPQGCCADPATTAVSGGVVLAATDREVKVYLPAAAGTPTAQVDLAG